MSGKIFFHQLHKHARILERHVRLCNLLEATMQVLCAERGLTLPLLQREFLMVEIGVAYSHYGVSLFSQEGLKLVHTGILALTGVESSFLAGYLSSLKEFILLSDEPAEKAREWLDDEALSRSFLHEFLKRIFCSRAQDDFDMCLNIFDADMVGELRLLANQRSLQNTDFACLKLFLEKMSSFFPNSEKFETFFLYHLACVQKDPLVCLRWRLESFISLAASSETPLLIYRDPLATEDLRAQKLSAIMMLLLPQEAENKLIPPLSTAQLAKLLPHSGGETKAALAQTLDDGVALDVLFKIPHGAKGNAYGLTERGLKVVGPLHAVMFFSPACKSLAPQTE